MTLLGLTDGVTTRLLNFKRSLREGLWMRLLKNFSKLSEEQDHVEHKLVENENDMMKLLNQGWELDREINHGKFLMERRALP